MMNILFDQHIQLPNANEITAVRVTQYGNNAMLLSIARSSSTSDTTFSINLSSFEEIAMLEQALQKAKENFTKVD